MCQRGSLLLIDSLLLDQHCVSLLLFELLGSFSLHLLVLGGVAVYQVGEGHF